MTDDLRIDDRHVIPAGELEITASRSSGPGGQHVNTADTRIQVRWNVPSTAALDAAAVDRVRQQLASRLSRDGDLVVACDTHRSQHRNREEALQRLAALVRKALQRPRRRKRTRKPRSAHERRLRQKRQRSDVKKMRRKPRRDD